MEEIIDIKDLFFYYLKDSPIFNGLNFSVKRGERIGFIGPNGAGKTTLFHLLMGLIRPVSGEIRILGTIRRSEQDFFEVRQRIGLLFQDSDDQLFCPTVEEDIAFGPLNLGKSHEEAKDIVKETCDSLGLKGLEKKITHRLSGGEKRLVALATVVAMNPDCFLLDEPTTGLDKTTSARLLQYLKGHAETYIIISHDIDFLNEVVEKVYILKDSVLQALEEWPYSQWRRQYGSDK